MRTEWQAVIGLEVHAQLRTASKLFASAATTAQHANGAVSPLCAGLPGTLPRLNAEALRLAVRAGLGLGCALQEGSRFARKCYFYADLPKGYQISQHRLPLCGRGALPFELDGALQVLELERIHMEEDAGKSVHGAIEGHTLIDLNRAGVPLIEIVSLPCLSSAAAAAAAFAELRLVLIHLGVSDGALEAGSMRCDANVSVRRHGETGLRTRCEVKNLNSLRSIREAVDYEIARQIDLWESGQVVQQQTRLWDVDAGRTRAMRGKEDAADYRYMPDPDLPPLHGVSALAERERATLPAPLAEVRQQLRDELALDEEQLPLLLESPALLAAALPLLRAAASDARALASFLFGPATFALRRADLELHDALAALPTLADICFRWRSGKLSNRMLSEVLAAVGDTNAGERSDADALRVRLEAALAAAGETLGDGDALRAHAEATVAAHPSEAAAFRDGKVKIMGFLMGQAMRRLGGRADAAALRAALERALAGR